MVVVVLTLPLLLLKTIKTHCFFFQSFFSKCHYLFSFIWLYHHIGLQAYAHSLFPIIINLLSKLLHAMAAIAAPQAYNNNNISNGVTTTSRLCSDVGHSSTKWPVRFHPHVCFYLILFLSNFDAILIFKHDDATKHLAPLNTLLFPPFLYLEKL